MMTGVRAGEGGRLCLPPAAWPAHDRALLGCGACPGDLLLDGGSGPNSGPAGKFNLDEFSLAQGEQYVDYNENRLFW